MYTPSDQEKEKVGKRLGEVTLGKWEELMASDLPPAVRHAALGAICLARRFGRARPGVPDIELMAKAYDVPRDVLAAGFGYISTSVPNSHGKLWCRDSWERYVPDVPLSEEAGAAFNWHTKIMAKEFSFFLASI